LDQIGQVDDRGKVIQLSTELNESDDEPFQEILSNDSDTELEDIRQHRAEAKRSRQERKEREAKKKLKPKRPQDSDDDEEKVEWLPDLPDVTKFDRVWVFPFFAKPGNHSYMIK
jgi:hypothetical protein